MQPVNCIFVSIASYCDPELIPTLRDMIATAEHPKNLHIAVCWQHDGEESLFAEAQMTLLSRVPHQGFELLTFAYGGASVQVISAHFFQSCGAGWARSMAESLYTGEAWFLQIDSHCRFIPQWDREMIAMVRELQGISAKPVLSTYPPAYDPADENVRNQFVNRLTFREFMPDGILMLSSVSFSAPTPVRGSYLAGGFIFATGSFVKDVPNDPHIFFAGEEIAMAVRAFTQGYEVYTPHKALLWHYYGRNEQRKIWGDHNNAAKEAGTVDLAWWERDKVSKSRVRTVLGVENPPVDLGDYGRGKVRSFAEFERMIGASFSHCTVMPDVVGKDRVSYFPPLDTSEESWLTGLIRPNKKKLTFRLSDLHLGVENTAWWHVGVYTESNVLLEQKTLTKANIEALVTAADPESLPLSFDFTTSAFHRPHSVRICPFITTEGWGNTVEKIW
ncbi:GlcNAc-transferase family protein [Buttiauxella agrestis]|uniref:GlcNAc-transferase family protein n=1 Tax=Buttiauxella agrestis TaxID=82977 RepID=UPI003976C368